MTKDERDILELLKDELEFIEKGGYGRSVRTPWLNKSIFQDSLSCINYGDPYHTQPATSVTCSSLSVPKTGPRTARAGPSGNSAGTNV